MIDQKDMNSKINQLSLEEIGILKPMIQDYGFIKEDENRNYDDIERNDNKEFYKISFLDMTDMERLYSASLYDLEYISESKEMVDNFKKDVQLYNRTLEKSQEYIATNELGEEMAETYLNNNVVGCDIGICHLSISLINLSPSGFNLDRRLT